MSNTLIGMIVAVITIGFIFWLVVFGGKRGEQHRERTTIKTRDPVRKP